VKNLTRDEDLEDLVMKCNGVYGYEKNSAVSKLSKVGGTVIDMLMGFPFATKPFHFPST
jgi:hypothetical protein